MTPRGTSAAIPTRATPDRLYRSFPYLLVFKQAKYREVCRSVFNFLQSVLMTPILLLPHICRFLYSVASSRAELIQDTNLRDL